MDSRSANISNSVAIDRAPPGLLVSVRDAGEARTCLEFPIAILDLKEPNAGSLGAVEPSTLQQVARLVAEYRLESPEVPLPRLSFAAGELVEWAGNAGGWANRVSRSLVGRFDFVKLGLAGALALPDWRSSWLQALADLPDSVQPVAVAYLDASRCEAPSVAEVLEFASRQPGVKTILLDTCQKSGTWKDWIDLESLARVVQAAHRSQLLTVFAGSVGIEDVAMLARTGTDCLGFRGALCNGPREGNVDRSRLAQLCGVFEKLGS